MKRIVRAVMGLCILGALAVLTINKRSEAASGSVPSRGCYDIIQKNPETDKNCNYQKCDCATAEQNVTISECKLYNETQKLSAEACMREKEDLLDCC